MGTETQDISWSIILRRWVYMVIAIVAALMLEVKPVFSFQEDKGIIYVRSYAMDQKTFIMTETEMATGASSVAGAMSVKWLYRCYQAMLVGCVLCFLCFFSWKGRVWIAFFTAVIAGSYYLLMIFYAVKISDNFFATLYPNYMAIMPAITCQMMLLVRRNVLNEVDEG